MLVFVCKFKFEDYTSKALTSSSMSTGEWMSKIPSDPESDCASCSGDDASELVLPVDSVQHNCYSGSEKKQLLSMQCAGSLFKLTVVRGSVPNTCFSCCPG